VEYPLNQAMQSTLAVRRWRGRRRGLRGRGLRGRVRGKHPGRGIGQPTNLDPALASALLGQARLAVSDAFRGPNGQALFGPAVAVPDSAGPADRLAGFLGRSV
jgi:hypothetical protein